MGDDLALAILMFFVGASALVAVVSVGARIALKPIIESWIRLREAGAAGQVQVVQAQRIELLEAELQSLQREIGKLVDAEEFRRQLESPVPNRM